MEKSLYFCQRIPIGNEILPRPSQPKKLAIFLNDMNKQKVIVYVDGFNINTYEEKGSDVRIATQIVNDAKNGDCDIAIVVSADSDKV